MLENYCSFTVCNLAYLHKALSLAESYKKNTGNLIKLYIFDEKREIPDFSDIAEIIWIRDLQIDNFNNLAFKYDVTEFTTSLKPYLASQLLENFDKVIFFDPDVFILNSISSILDLLDKHPIVLTPHYVMPQESGTDLDQSDLGMLRFGSFNLGFFAVSKVEGKEFLNWWDKRCKDLCFFETQFGLSTDQKWVSIAPCFFPNLHISFDLGLNVSFWNLHERSVAISDNTNYLVNDKYELIFFHFSSYNQENPEALTTRPFKIDLKSAMPIQKLISTYDQVHKKFLLELTHVDKKYSFDFMSDGSYIPPILRSAYASVFNDEFNAHDPFDSAGKVGSFAKKNKLYMRKQQEYRPQGIEDLNEHKLKYSVLLRLIRLILWILGPLKFQSFTRLLVYLSSPRMVKDLWKT